MDDNIKYMTDEFNKNRKFVIKDIPPATYQEVKNYVGDHFPVSNITISKKFRHSIVTLLHGEQAEDVVKELSDKQFLDATVEISLLQHENMMCVSQVPLDVTQEEFKEKLQPYGIIERCFLMTDSKKEKSKGYGFVEYAHNKEFSMKACRCISNMKINGSKISCSFLESSILRFEQLWSKCLLIRGFTFEQNNAQEIRNMCGVIDQPSWIEIGQLKGDGKGIAVVEYSSHQSADLTLEKIHGHVLNEDTLHVCFCRPTEDPQVIYREFMNTDTNDIKNSDFDQLPTNSTYLASPVVKQLLEDKPDALQNFAQVLELLSTQLQQNLQSQQSDQPGLLGPMPIHAATTLPIMNPQLQISLLSVLIAMQIQQTQPQFIGDPYTQQMILNGLENKKTNTFAGSDVQNFGSTLHSYPSIAKANCLLKQMFVKPAESVDTPDVNVDSTPHHPNYHIFPGAENDTLNNEILTDFNHIVSALTPESKSTSCKARTVPQKSNNDKSNVDTNFLKPNESLLGPIPKFNNQPGILGTFPGNFENICKTPINFSDKEDKEMQSLSTLSSSPLFDLPEIGVANPFLAAYIENQIKDHLNEDEQSNTIAPPAQLPTSDGLLGDIPISHIPGASHWFNFHSSGNHFQNTGILKLNVHSSNILQQGSLLGEPPAHFQASNLYSGIQDTPLSRNKSHRNQNECVTDKRILNFDDNCAVADSSKSLLGEPPMPFPRSLMQTSPGSDNMKRKIAHLLPSPEDSPDGPYIGQHSQGLGGHYADTFYNKRSKQF